MHDTFPQQEKKRFTLPFTDTLIRVVSQLSISERIVFCVLGILMAMSALTLLLNVHNLFLVEVPTHGGSVREGIVGSPRFINPILAISDADRDVTQLIFSGLLRATPEGTLIPDLAKEYHVSPDGLTYTFTLRENLTFHDGKPLTAEDVVFTIERAQDPSIKSPKRANWDSVVVTAVNDREITFTLKQAYAPFLENTTLGILPKHLWKNVLPEQFPLSFVNVEPIGSGPYHIKEAVRNSSGIPERYVLSAFENNPLGEAYIETVELIFADNEQELLDSATHGDLIGISSVTPENAEGIDASRFTLYSAPLSRVFGIFFNQNQNALFANQSVRQALDIAIDKEAIVKEVLAGFGVVADGPFPAVSRIETANTTELSTTTDRMIRARAILEKNGFVLGDDGVYKKTDKKKNSTEILSFTLSTSNATELKKTAELVQKTWQELGAKVELHVFEPGDLSQNTIRPRKYDALLFGEIIGRDLDLFAFWHSSQRNDPGLNIALYTNTKADKLLSDARTELNREKRIELYTQFEEMISAETPAIFLYSPSLIYVSPKKISGIEIGNITTPSERFLSINDWYIETEKVWKFFTSEQFIR